MGSRILVVDDAVDIRLALGLRLSREGYEVVTAESGAQALETVEREGLPDLVLLDIIMPDIDGFAVAERLNEMGDFPIIFLTVLNDIEHQAIALAQYGDDFITKPYVFADLLARIQRQLMRADRPAKASPEIDIGPGLRANFALNYVIVDERPIRLTPTESRILEILFHSRGNVVSYSHLLSQAWLTNRTGQVKSLWVHVRRLRTKIEQDPENPRHLITVRGHGYLLD